MRTPFLMCALTLAVLEGSLALAAPLTFDISGDPDVTGYVIFDDNHLSPAFGCQSDSAIIDLQTTVTAGGAAHVFTTSDVAAGDSTFIPEK